jgi:hypothetical protein
MKTKTTRRNLLGVMCAFIAAPFTNANTSKNSAQVITAGDTGAENLECYDAATGDIQDLVKTVAVGQWIEKYDAVRTFGGERPRMLCYPDGSPILRKVYGDFRIRPKQKVTSIFGHNEPTLYDEQVVKVSHISYADERLKEDLVIQRRTTELTNQFTP